MSNSAGVCSTCSSNDHERCLKVWWVEDASGWSRVRCTCCPGSVACYCGECDACLATWPRRLIRRTDEGTGARQPER